ncbi:MAG: hypothetical protein RIG62_06875 [Cyclobacteriaceae bacterium]
MKPTLLLLLPILLSLNACNNQPHYEPEGLRKLSDAELLERARTRNFLADPGRIVYRDTLGNVISLEEVRKLDREEYFGVQYVDANGEVAETVIRRATEADKELMKQLTAAFEEGEPITMINIDCANISEILAEVHALDQANRQGGSVGNSDVDLENQQKVVSIIENCGFPTVESHGYKSVEAVFLVIQHASKGLRKKYFPSIKKSADEGDLPWRIVALMEDRVLTDQGKKQKYGSQVEKVNGSDQWSVCPIEDPENVNERRAQVGLEPIEEYLQYFDIAYQVEK